MGSALPADTEALDTPISVYRDWFVAIRPNRVSRSNFLGNELPHQPKTSSCHIGVCRYRSCLPSQRSIEFSAPRRKALPRPSIGVPVLRPESFDAPICPYVINY